MLWLKGTVAVDGHVRNDRLYHGLQQILGCDIASRGVGFQPDSDDEEGIPRERTDMAPLRGQQCELEQMANMGDEQGQQQEPRNGAARQSEDRTQTAIPRGERSPVPSGHLPRSGRSASSTSGRGASSSRPSELTQDGGSVAAAPHEAESQEGLMGGARGPAGS